MRELWKSESSPGLTTVCELLTWPRHRGCRAALVAKRQGQWREWSGRQLYDQVRGVDASLRALHAPGERVAILAESSPEWVIADGGCLAAGLIDVPIYPTLTAEQVAYILQDSGAAGVFVSSRAQAEKVAAVAGGLPQLRWICVFEGVCGATGGLIEHDWRAWIEAAPAGAEAEAGYEARLRSTPADRVATLIYTSGTTGEPKGVMLTHANLCANLNVSTMDFYFGPEERRLSILPLAHITERHICYADRLFDASTWFAESLDKVLDNLGEVKPTFLVSVPRLFEKMAAAVQVQALAKPRPLRSIYRWALAVGRQMSPYWLAGWPPPGPRIPRRPGAPEPPARLRWRAALADRLVYAKLRQRLGGKLTKICCGGAPLGRELCEYLLSLGLVVDEGYGLTETSPVVAINRPGGRRPGSIGRPLPNVEVRFAPDGELLLRGPSIFSGYYRLPQATAEALADGWFHTGDIGRQDEDGFLYITDRKKDLIKTAGGKFIAPQPIEARLKASPYIGEAVIVGDRKPYAVALIVPNFAALEAWAAERRLACADRRELCAQPAVQALYQAEMDQVNARLARFETLKKFALLSREFTLAGGELTPTIKVRRRSVERNYAGVIEALYREPASRYTDQQ